MSVNQQRLHTQDESPLFEAQEQEEAPQYDDVVKVRVVNEVATTTGADQFGIYSTYVIPPSTSTVVSYLQILARDPLRQYAYVTTIDEPIILGTTLEEVQSIANVTATYPSGGYTSGGWLPPIRHNDPVWAANTSTTSSTRVVVLVERGRHT